MGYKYTLPTITLASYIKYIRRNIFSPDIKNEIVVLLKKKRQLSQESHETRKMNIENPKQISQFDKENVSFIKLESDVYL